MEPTDVTIEILKSIRDEIRGTNVTERICSEFIPREDLREEPEVHVAGACIRKNHRGEVEVLIARRSAKRKIGPGKIAGCGGQLRRSETFTEGVARHFATEMGVDVVVYEERHCFYLIDSADHPKIPGIRFLCLLKSGEPRSQNYDEIRWVSRAEFEEMPESEFLGNVKEQTLVLILDWERAADSTCQPPSSPG